MSTAWKAFERTCATALGAKRHWANAGNRIDFTGDVVVGQCKLVKHLSLEQLTRLAEEMEALAHGKLGVVCTKVRRGYGVESPVLITLTLKQFCEWFDFSDRRGSAADEGETV